MKKTMKRTAALLLALVLVFASASPPPTAQSDAATQAAETEGTEAAGETGGTYTPGTYTGEAALSSVRRQESVLPMNLTITATLFPRWSWRLETSTTT